MVTIDNYSFVCIENDWMRLADEKEINDSKREIVVIGKIGFGKQEPKTYIIDVQKHEQTYIIGSYNSYNTIYYFGKKSKEMRLFEKMKRENIPTVTSFSIGYACYSGKFGKHIPCIVGHVEHEEKEKVIFVDSQNFEENTIVDVNGQKYFLDWISMLPWQYQKMKKEALAFPASLKKNFGVFCEKGLKLDMFALSNYLPILGTAGAFEIK